MGNRTSVTLDLHVNGEYGCRALGGLHCTTQVKPGSLSLVAKGPNGESAATETSVEEGEVVTWTITEE